MRLPPARNLETTKKTFPDARRCTISLREEQIFFCTGKSFAFPSWILIHNPWVERLKSTLGILMWFVVSTVIAYHIGILDQNPMLGTRNFSLCCNVTSAAFSRCWIRNPDGPHAVAFGKDLKTDKILKYGGRIGGGCQMSRLEGLQEVRHLKRVNIIRIICSRDVY